MSTATARTLSPSVAPDRISRPSRPLRVVEAPRRRRRPRVLYGIVAVLGVFAVGAAQMWLSIITTQTSYQIAELTQQHRELGWEKQILFDEVAGLSSPQYLAANAAALGMVIDESPSYLRLSDAKILGTSDAAVGSSVDAIGRGAVPNALIATTPLVTEPDATIDGLPVTAVPPPADGATTVPNTPAPLTEGLPTPSTH
jgi:cell division protein FtsB